MDGGHEPAERAAALRFAVLTRQNSTYGIELLRRLAAIGLRPTCIGVETVSWRRRWSTARLLARKTSAVNAVYHNARIWSRVLLRAAAATDYSPFADRLYTSDDMNGAPMRDFLAGCNLDLLVLGQSGIVRPQILALPRIGTLNAHPGRLPFFRGVDVVRWTLLARQPPAVSLHFADEGVDTGDIVEVRDVAVRPDDAITEIESRAVDLSLSVLADSVARLAGGERLPRLPQRQEEGRQYYLMPPWTALRLQAQWRAIRSELAAAFRSGEPARSSGARR